MKSRVAALGATFLEVTRADFENLKTLGERTFLQLDDADFHWRLDEESNSIYVLVKHLAGNMRSRWTDFLSSDGEKPDRDRDSEFLGEGVGRADILALWERGWTYLFRGLDALTPDDLLRTVYIRGQPHSVVQAISRQLTHHAYHVGQIVLLAKHRKGHGWRTLSIPRGRSADYLPPSSDRTRGPA